MDPNRYKFTSTTKSIDYKYLYNNFGLIDFKFGEKGHVRWSIMNKQGLPEYQVTFESSYFDKQEIQDERKYTKCIEDKGSKTYRMIKSAAYKTVTFKNYAFYLIVFTIIFIFKLLKVIGLLITILLTK